MKNVIFNCSIIISYLITLFLVYQTEYIVQSIFILLFFIMTICLVYSMYKD
jgi:hypothetical protein